MSKHYDDYAKKSVSASDLTFDKVAESDKDVIREVRKTHIKKNVVFLIVLTVLFVPFT